MKFERKHALALFAVIYIAVLFAMYTVLFKLGPLKEELLRFDGDPMEHGYKIFFFAMSTFPVVYIAFLVTLLASIQYLRTKEMRFDSIASNSVKIGILFTSLLLVNGAIFSKVSWGAYWNWDPRQTTTLILWFVLAGYLSLRSAIDNEETKARLSAVIGILGFAGVPLTHVSATIWLSNHPQLYQLQGKPPFSLDKLGGAMFGVMVFSLLAIYLYLLWAGMRIDEHEKSLSS